MAVAYSTVEIPDPHRFLILETRFREGAVNADRSAIAVDVTTRGVAACDNEEDADLVVAALRAYKP